MNSPVKDTLQGVVTSGANTDKKLKGYEQTYLGGSSLDDAVIVAAAEQIKAMKETIGSGRDQLKILKMLLKAA